MRKGRWWDIEVTHTYKRGKSSLVQNYYGLASSILGAEDGVRPVLSSPSHKSSRGQLISSNHQPTLYYTFFHLSNTMVFPGVKCCGGEMSGVICLGVKCRRWSVGSEVLRGWNVGGDMSRGEMSGVIYLGVKWHGGEKTRGWNVGGEVSGVKCRDTLLHICTSYCYITTW